MIVASPFPLHDYDIVTPLQASMFACEDDNKCRSLLVQCLNLQLLLGGGEMDKGDWIGAHIPIEVPRPAIDDVLERYRLAGWGVVFYDAADGREDTHSVIFSKK